MYCGVFLGNGCVYVFVRFWEVLGFFLLVDIFEYVVIGDGLIMGWCFVDWVEVIVVGDFGK